MPLGYHYTTRKNWEGIQAEGLYPNKIRQHELERMQQAMPKMPHEAVWVWKNRLTIENAWIVTSLLATIHQDFNLVLLGVEYCELDAMSQCYRPNPENTVRLTCHFSAPNMDTGPLPIELLQYHIPPEQITLIGNINLFEPLEEHHETLRNPICT